MMSFITDLFPNQDFTDKKSLTNQLFRSLIIAVSSGIILLGLYINPPSKLDAITFQGQYDLLFIFSVFVLSTINLLVNAACYVAQCRKEKCNFKGLSKPLIDLFCKMYDYGLNNLIKLPHDCHTDELFERNIVNIDPGNNPESREKYFSATRSAINEVKANDYEWPKRHCCGRKSV